MEDILNLNDRLNALNERKNKLEQDEASLTAWQAYDLPLELTGTKKTLVQTGVLPMGTDTDALAGALAGRRKRTAQYSKSFIRTRICIMRRF